MSYEFKDNNGNTKNFLDEIEKFGFKKTEKNCYTLGDMSIYLNMFGKEDDAVMCCAKDSVFVINPVDVFKMKFDNISSDHMNFFHIGFKTKSENVCAFTCNVNIT